MSCDPKANLKCGQLYPVYAFPHQFPKPDQIGQKEFQNFCEKGTNNNKRAILLYTLNLFAQLIWHLNWLTHLSMYHLLHKPPYGYRISWQIDSKHTVYMAQFAIALQLCVKWIKTPNRFPNERHPDFFFLFKNKLHPY